MSTVAPSRVRAARDPGRMYPPPPLSRWGLAVRWGITLLAAVAMVLLGIAAATLGEGPISSPAHVVIDVVLTIAAGVLIRYRRQRPLLVCGLIVTMGVVSVGASCFFPWAMVSLCTRRRRREVLPMSLYAMVMQIVMLLVPWGPGTPTIIVGVKPAQDQVIAALLMISFSFLFLGVFVGFGFYVGARRDLVASLTERAETAEREQQLMVAAGQATERARIAREMHDVLAHRISLVSMHAGVLAYREDLPLDQTKQIAGIIQENAHASLTELRQVLSSLRGPAELGTPVEKPQPTLADLTELVREAELSGTHVELRNELVDPAAVPPTVARHAYRMMQEALTNARKHAGGAPVWVSLWGRPGKGLSFEVRNSLMGGSGDGAQVPGSGLGLVGLAERAQLQGGTFRAGADHGDFVVTAWLPWDK